MDEHEQLVTKLGQLVDQFDRNIRRGLPAAWPDIDLTLPQIRTLVSLADGPERMSEIAAQGGTSLSAATAMIDRLVEKGLVVRSQDPRDRRVVVCELTDAGRETLRSLWSIRQDSLRELARHMSEQELRTVVDALEILVRAAGRPAGADNGAATS
ncbi:MAG TPA: MarR family transcriptional regulator [Thermomicrobiales bacterium]|nr:MarR family transcriptional regulator [Thermomicrobiales bacterium]